MLTKLKDLFPTTLSHSMTTTMDLSTDSKFERDRWSGSPKSFSGSMSFHRSGSYGMSRSYSTPTWVKVADVEAGKVMNGLKTTVEKDRKELDELNAKLSEYILSVRSKEALNKQLQMEIERLKETFFQAQNNIREEYAIQIEMIEARLREQTEEVAPLKAKVVSLEQTVEMKDKEVIVLQKRVEELQVSLHRKDRTIVELEGECAVLKNQLQEIRQDNKRIRTENDRIRSEQEIALTKQIKAQNECDTLVEEKKYLEITLNAEIRRLNGLLSAFEFTQPNLEEVLKSEFRECITSIRAEYESQLAKLNTERSGSYGVEYKQLEAKHSEMCVRYDEEYMRFERETSEMQKTISELQSELSAVTALLTSVRADSLNTEISRYRRLLEGKAETQAWQNTQMTSVVKGQTSISQEKKSDVSAAGSILSSVESSLQENAQKTSVVKGRTSTSHEKKSDASVASSVIRSSSIETSGKVVTSQSHGMLTPLSIKEVESAGNFILINNSSKNEMDLSNWHIDRTSPKGKVSFTIPNGTKIGGEKEMKIFASKNADKKGPHDLVATCKTWGSGNGQVKVTDEKGQEVILFTYTFKEN